MPDEEFWSDWVDKFKTQADSLITPNNSYVQNHASKVSITPAMDSPQKVTQIWHYIAEEIRYKLSKEWKTPEETLTSRIGDCEDVDFLFISMLPHHGITTCNLQIGYLTYPDKSREAHTWVKHNGRIIDPTAFPQELDGNRYKPQRSIQINVT